MSFLSNYRQFILLCKSLTRSPLFAYCNIQLVWLEAGLNDVIFEVLHREKKLAASCLESVITLLTYSYLHSCEETTHRFLCFAVSVLSAHGHTICTQIVFLLSHITLVLYCCATEIEKYLQC